MKERPFCFVAVIYLIIQAVLTVGLRTAEDPGISPLESCAEDGRRVTVTGIVIQREEGTAYRTYCLKEVRVRLEGQSGGQRGEQIQRQEQVLKESKILVYIEDKNADTIKKNKKAAEISIGDRARFTGKLSFYEKERNPGNFDQRAYYRKQGIHARVWAESAAIIEKNEDPLREGLARFKISWRQKLEEAMGGYYGGIMSAVLLGDRSGLDEDIKELYQKSGLGHILAISGLHMSFLGIGFYRLLRKAGLGFYPAGITGSLFLLLYTIMTGGGVSSLRALTMFMVYMGAEMTGRTYDLPTGLALAAVVIVQRQPLYLTDAGFLLSFGAILGIALIAPLLEQFRVFPGAVCASLSIGLILLPVLLYFYYEIPTYSLLLNLLFIPLMSGVLGFGIAGSLLTVCWPGGGTVLLHVCRWILELYEAGCLFSMKLPLARFVAGRPPRSCIVGYYVLVLAGCIAGYHLKKRQKGGKHEKTVLCTHGLRLGSLLLPAVFCLACASAHAKAGELQVTLLDVGQGDCLYIRMPDGQDWLIDGGSTDISDVGKYRIGPYLRSQGVSTLDHVFLSHGDEDHIGGVRELLEDQLLGIRIETLVLPPRQVLDEALWALAREAAACGTRVVTMEAGQQISGGEAVLSCLAPGAGYQGEKGNEASMVLLLKYRSFSMLFTGDVEGEGEEELLEQNVLRDCDVLKVAHHGSKNTTSEEFLARVRPEIALISAGRENRYGHPHEETVMRLKGLCGKEQGDTGCRIYNTQKDGAVTLRTDGRTIRTKTCCTG